MMMVIFSQDPEALSNLSNLGWGSAKVHFQIGCQAARLVRRKAPATF